MAAIPSISAQQVIESADTMPQLSMILFVNLMIRNGVGHYSQQQWEHPWTTQCMTSCIAYGFDGNLLVQWQVQNLVVESLGNVKPLGVSSLSCLVTRCHHVEAAMSII